MDGIFAGSAWLVTTAAAVISIALGRDEVAAACVIASGVAALAFRQWHRQRLRPILVDGAEALGVAAIAISIAATDTTPAIVGGAAIVAFALVVQQYTALVHRQLAATAGWSEHRVVAAPLGVVALAGLGALLWAGRPVSLALGIAGWASIDALRLAIAFGRAIHAHERIGARPPRLPVLHGRARWQRLGEGLAAARDAAFWGLVVARPIARAILQGVAERRVLTPNRITAASVVACLGAATLIAASTAPVATAVAIVLIGIRSVLDSLDGQLARYRACGSQLGSYVDKVSDLFCWGALFAALAVRAYAAEPTPSMILLPAIAALSLALQGFALWLARALGAMPTAAAGEPADHRGGLAGWARGLWRIVLFEEPDFYLWIALAVATARYDLFVPFIAGAYVARSVVLGLARVGAVGLGTRALAKEGA